MTLNPKSRALRLKHRRKIRHTTGQAATRAVLGDGNGAISVIGQPHLYWVRIATGLDDDGNTEYGNPTAVLSGGGYGGTEKIGTAVYIGRGYDGQLAILGTDRTALVAQGINPRVENPNSAYSKWVLMENAVIGYVSPVGTGQTDSMEVLVYPLVYIDANGVLQVAAPEGEQFDFTSDIPAADGDDNNLKLIVGLFIDANNELESQVSTAVLESDTLDWTTDVAEVVAAASARAIPLRFYVLTTGQTNLLESDEFGDGRQWVNTPTRKNNFAATAAPTVNDDIDTGVNYEVGSWWFDVTNDDVYYCIDSTSGAAIWHKVNVTYITRTTAATYNVITGDTEIFANTDSNAVTVNLQAGTQNRKLRIVNTGSSGANVTIAPNGAELVIGMNNSFVLLDSEVIIITYDTTDGWY